MANALANAIDWYVDDNNALRMKVTDNYEELTQF